MAEACGALEGLQEWGGRWLLSVRAPAHCTHAACLRWVRDDSNPVDEQPLLLKWGLGESGVSSRPMGSGGVNVVFSPVGQGGGAVKQTGHIPDPIPLRH